MESTADVAGQNPPLESSVLKAESILLFSRRVHCTGSIVAATTAKATASARLESWLPITDY